MTDYRLLMEAIRSGNVDETLDQMKSFLAKGNAPEEIITRGVIAALDNVGKRFSRGECFLPEMLIAARASQRGLALLKPLIVKNNPETLGRVVIGTVKGDLHDIGKNIVVMMLNASGFEVMDLGADVFPENFIQAIKSFNPGILALSCLLSTTTEAMVSTIAAVNEAGLRKRVKIIIGGPPTSEDFALKIGADYHGRDAYAGVEIARKISLLKQT